MESDQPTPEMAEKPWYVLRDENERLRRRIAELESVSEPADLESLRISKDAGWALAEERNLLLSESYAENMQLETKLIAKSESLQHCQEELDAASCALEDIRKILSNEKRHAVCDHSVVMLVSRFYDQAMERSDITRSLRFGKEAKEWTAKWEAKLRREKGLLGTIRGQQKSIERLQRHLGCLEHSAFSTKEYMERSTSKGQVVTLHAPVVSTPEAQEAVSKRVAAAMNATSPSSDELDPLRFEITKGRTKYPNGCTILSLVDEAGEVLHAINKYEGVERVREEILQVAAVAMRLYFGEIDHGLVLDGLAQTPGKFCVPLDEQSNQDPRPDD